MNVKNIIGNYSKLFKCKLDVCAVYNVRHNFNEALVIGRKEGLKFTQVRYKSSRSEAPPVPRKGIPFANPNFKQNKGGKLLLIVPVITFGLGTWQVYRLKWKTELIKNMEEQSRMDPVPLPLDPEEVKKMEYRKVSVTGRFDHSSEVYYGPKPCLVNGDVQMDVVHPSGRDSFGYNLVTPLVLSDSGERILVNRGWIRTKTIKKKDRPWSNTEGEELTITGVVRLPEQKRKWGPETDDRYNIWHYRDIEDLADKLDCLPIWIDATDEHSIPGKLWAGQTVMAIRNEHLQYIFTWYMLTVAIGYMWYLRYVKGL